MSDTPLSMNSQTLPNLNAPNIGVLALDDIKSKPSNSYNCFVQQDSTCKRELKKMKISMSGGMSKVNLNAKKKGVK